MLSKRDPTFLMHNYSYLCGAPTRIGASALEACCPLTFILNPAAQNIKRPKHEYQSINVRLQPLRLTWQLEAISEAEIPMRPEKIK